jgi:hypothetical protein
MKNFFLDLWSDLREKRLWPVAAVLLAGLVAVPVVLSKPSEEPPAPQPTQTSAERATPDDEGPDALASVKLDEVAAGTGSALDTFDPSNPFLPPDEVVEDDEVDSLGATEAGPTDTGVPGGSGSSSELDVGEVDSGEDTTGGTTPPDDNESDGTGDDKKTTTQYAYVIDLTFTANGRKRKVTGMEKLDILPNQASPLLIFMGVTDNAGNAVFLVDSTLQTAGEGTCKPSGTECAFLYLGPGSEQEFTTDDGDSYTLLIDQIRKVKLGADESTKKGKTARAAVGSPPSPRRFVAPILADLVSVSSGADFNSNSNRDRR